MDFLNITILVVWKLTISFLYEVYINKSILSPLYYDLVQCFSCILADYSQDILNWAIFLIYAYILYKNSYFILMIVVSAHPYKFKMLKYLKENFNIHLYLFFFSLTLSFILHISEWFTTMSMFWLFLLNIKDVGFVYWYFYENVW